MKLSKRSTVSKFSTTPRVSYYVSHTAIILATGARTERGAWTGRGTWTGRRAAPSGFRDRAPGMVGVLGLRVLGRSPQQGSGAKALVGEG